MGWRVGLGRRLTPRWTPAGVLSIPAGTMPSFPPGGRRPVTHVSVRYFCSFHLAYVPFTRSPFLLPQQELGPTPDASNLGRERCLTGVEDPLAVVERAVCADGQHLRPEDWSRLRSSHPQLLRYLAWPGVSGPMPSLPPPPGSEAPAFSLPCVVPSLPPMTATPPASMVS